MSKNKPIRQLAEEHWDWIESILRQEREMTRRLFIDGMIHGYKHRDEEDNENHKAE